MNLLTAKDFPRWTRAKLGLPATANLVEELDRRILKAEDHVRGLIGDTVFDELSEISEANATRRRRFQTALVDLVESSLHTVAAEHLGSQVGSSTQGSRSRTIAAEAKHSATQAANRSYADFAEGMFRLGYTVRREALGIHYTPVSR